MYNKYKNNSILSFYYEQNKMLESKSKFVMPWDLMPIKEKKKYFAVTCLWNVTWVTLYSLTQKAASVDVTLTRSVVEPPRPTESQHYSTDKLPFLSPSIASHFEISAETAAAAAAAPAVPLQ